MRRGEGVIAHARRRVFRHLAGQHRVQRGGRAVDIRPLPVRSLSQVLLEGCVSGGENGRQTLTAFAHCLPRRPEVE